MTRPRRQKRTRAIDATTLPALVAFARGYLHQDFEAEYGSARGAAKAFAADASAAERTALAADLRQAATSLAARSPKAIAMFFRDELRSAWAPVSVAELRDLETSINDG